MTAKKVHAVQNTPFLLIELSDLLHFRSNLWAGAAFVVSKEGWTDTPHFGFFSLAFLSPQISREKTRAFRIKFGNKNRPSFSSLIGKSRM